LLASVTNSRTFADTGVAGSAPTENRKYGWYSVPAEFQPWMVATDP